MFWAAWYLIFDIYIWYLILDTWYLILDTWYLILDIWYLILPAESLEGKCFRLRLNVFWLWSAKSSSKIETLNCNKALTCDKEISQIYWQRRILPTLERKQVNTCFPRNFTAADKKDLKDVYLRSQNSATIECARNYHKLWDSHCGLYVVRIQISQFE